MEGQLFKISDTDFDHLCECGAFGRTEKAYHGFSVVVCGQGNHYRATVWKGLDRVKRGQGDTPEMALYQVVVRLTPPGQE